MSRCYVVICCCAFLGVAGIAASFGTSVDSLVVVGVCYSLPDISYISWFWLGLVDSWQVFGVWYLGWSIRTVCASSAVGGGPVDRGASWSDVPRRLWLWGTRRT
jgi:hypothetical protein